MFGDILFADGLLGDTGGIIPATEPFWSENCKQVSQWNIENETTTLWSTVPKQPAGTLECE